MGADGSSSRQPYSLNDTQTNAEYVANAIEILHSGYCRPFPVLGLDQGAIICMSGWTHERFSRKGSILIIISYTSTMGIHLLAISS